jgi:hypothetical protein
MSVAQAVSIYLPARSPSPDENKAPSNSVIAVATNVLATTSCAASAREVRVVARSVARDNFTIENQCGQFLTVSKSERNRIENNCSALLRLEQSLLRKEKEKPSKTSKKIKIHEENVANGALALSKACYAYAESIQEHAGAEMERMVWYKKATEYAKVCYSYCARNAERLEHCFQCFEKTEGATSGLAAQCAKRLFGVAPIMKHHGWYRETQRERIPIVQAALKGILKIDEILRVEDEREKLCALPIVSESDLRKAKELFDELCELEEIEEETSTPIKRKWEKVVGFAEALTVRRLLASNKQVAK